MLSRSTGVHRVPAWRLVLASVGLAHLGHVIQQAERYIKLDVSGYRVRVVVSLTLGAQEMSRVMHQADTDQNG